MLDTYQYKTPPYAHQRAELEATWSKPYWGHLWDMGTGKSKIVCDTLARQHAYGTITGAIILAPKGCYLNWVTDEIPKHLPDWCLRTVVPWTGKDGKDYAQLGTVSPELKILVVNVEALAYESGEKMVAWFVRRHAGRVALVVDESTTLKNPRAKRTKTATRLAKACCTRRILTGTAMENRPLDVFSQFNILDYGLLGFTSFTAFRSHFAVTRDILPRGRSRPVQVVTGYKNMDDLRARVVSHASIIRSEECLDLPPKVYQVRHVEMGDEQARLYTQMAKHSVAELSSTEVVTATVVLAKLTRLHQIVCGHIRDEDGAEHAVEHHRLDALDEVLEEHGGKAIIFANHRHCIREVSQHLADVYGPEAVATYYGDTAIDEREEAKRAFQTGDALRFLVVNPQTGGFGLTLTAANLTVYYSNDFDAERRAQSEKRAHRIGQTRTCTYVDLVCRGTVDEKILDAVRGKRSLAASVLTSTWRDLI